MNKTIKIILNIFIFLMVAGFITYIIQSMNQEERTWIQEKPEKPFVSNYQKVSTMDMKDTINAFEIKDKQLFIVSGKWMKVFNVQENSSYSFRVKPHARDIQVSKEQIYLLYPTFIDVYSHQGDSLYSWEACSNLSDYCSFTLAGDFVFVTDAGNKNIGKYTKEGNFVQFIQSPQEFITPSYTFDITNRNDTIYCVNPGRHLIETYTLEGDFIAAFGGPGTEAGFFAGCCNPAFISFSHQGHLLTSEKGNPRICSYNKDGTFNEVILNSRLLGGGHVAYEVKEMDNQLFVASKNQISIYQKKDSI